MSSEREVGKSRDYRRALDFEVSVTHLQERSERRAWHVAAAAVVMAILCAVALAVMVPFYRVVPLPIEVDRLTGEAQVIDAVQLSGYDAAAEGFNEHVWYDYPTMSKLVDAVAASLHTADPAHALAYSRAAEKLQTELSALESDEQALAASTAGIGVAITKPVPDYVLHALQMDVVTPTAFSKAIEDGTDVSATVLQQTLAQLADGTARILVYNVQTTGAQTDAVLAAAKRNGVPAVPVSETLPSGLHYVEWQQGVLATIAEAVKQ